MSYDSTNCERCKESEGSECRMGGNLGYPTRLCMSCHQAWAELVRTHELFIRDRENNRDLEVFSAWAEHAPASVEVAEKVRDGLRALVNVRDELDLSIYKLARDWVRTGT